MKKICVALLFYMFVIRSSAFTKNGVCGIDQLLVDGNCTECPVGYIGPNCSDECPSGFYGQNCIFPCSCKANQICDQIDGCIGTNKTGNFTIDLDETHGQTTFIWYLVISVLGGSTVLLILLAVSCYCRRRIADSGEKQDNVIDGRVQEIQQDTPPVFNGVYEEIDEVEPIYTVSSDENAYNLSSFSTKKRYDLPKVLGTTSHYGRVVLTNEQQYDTSVMTIPEGYRPGTSPGIGAQCRETLDNVYY